MLRMKRQMKWILIVNLNAKFLACVFFVRVAKNGVSTRHRTFSYLLLIHANDINVEAETGGVQFTVGIATTFRVPVCQDCSLPTLSRVRYIKPDRDLPINKTPNPYRLRVKVHDSRRFDIGKAIERVSRARDDEDGEHTQRMGFCHGLL